MISRCLSGQWLIHPSWLLQHSDQVLLADKGEDTSKIWPKMQSHLVINAGGHFAAAAQSDTIGKGQALGVINVVGPIYKYYGSKQLVSYLNAMASDDRVAGVKMIIDSPGGQLHGTREAYEAILNFPKPILAAVDGYAASAAYYQIAGADRIVATQPNDQIGSIGTLATLADWNKYYKSIGLDLYEIYAAASTEKNAETRQIFASEGKETALMQQQLTTYNNQFISDVRAGRGDRLTGKGLDPMSGGIFFPEEAITNGLIDELISEGETLALLGDMVATNKQSSITMNFIDFWNSLGAQLNPNKGEQAGQQSSENQAPSNEQLAASIAQLNTAVSTAQGQITTLTTSLEAANAQVTTLTTERDALQAKVDEYGDQPGAMKTKAQKEKDDHADDAPKGWEAVVAGLEHNKTADQLGLGK